MTNTYTLILNNGKLLTKNDISFIYLNFINYYMAYFIFDINQIYKLSKI